MTGFHESNFSNAYSSHISWQSAESPARPNEMYPSLAFDSLFENGGSGFRSALPRDAQQSHHGHLRQRRRETDPRRARPRPAGQRGHAAQHQAEPKSFADAGCSAATRPAPVSGDSHRASTIAATHSARPTARQTACHRPSSRSPRPRPARPGMPSGRLEQDEAEYPGRYQRHGNEEARGRHIGPIATQISDRLVFKVSKTHRCRSDSEEDVREKDVVAFCRDCPGRHGTAVRRNYLAEWHGNQGDIADREPGTSLGERQSQGHIVSSR